MEDKNKEIESLNQKHLEEIEAFNDRIAETEKTLQDKLDAI